MEIMNQPTLRMIFAETDLSRKYVVILKQSLPLMLRNHALCVIIYLKVEILDKDVNCILISVDVILANFKKNDEKNLTF